MASFNPAIQPTQAPDYSGYSRVIEPAPANQSTKIALQSIGEGITDVSKLADTWVKENTKEDAQKAFDPIIKDNIEALERIKAEGIKSVVPGPQADASGSVMDANASADVPEDVENGVSGIQTLQAAKAAGKLNDTAYDQKLYSELKRLRAQNPGYRDYIDEQASKITGKNIANSLYKNLMEDINRNATNANSEKNKIQSLLDRNIDIPGVTEVGKAWRAGITSDDGVREFLNRNLETKYKFDRLQQQRTLDEQDKKLTVEKTKTDAIDEFVTIAANRFSNINTITGMTPAMANDIIIKSQTGESLPLTDLQAQQFGEVLQGRRTQVEAELRTLAAKRGYSAKIGDTQFIESTIKNTLAGYDVAIANIRDKDTGAGFSTMREMVARGSDEFKKISDHPTMGRFLSLGGALKKAGGDQFASTVVSVALANGMSDAVNSWLKDTKMVSMLPDSARPGEKPKSLISDINEAQTKGLPRKVYPELIDNIKTINNPQAPDNIKAEVADYMFRPENLGLLDKFKMDYVDPQTGKTVPGKNAVFQRLTNPDITDNVYKVSRDNPQIWTNYKDWGEQSFKTLYKSELKTLNEATEGVNSPVKVGWDSENRRFELRNLDGTEFKINPRFPYSPQIYTAINRINSGLSNLSRIHDKEKRDTASYLLDILTTSGFKPNENMPGIPEQMKEAIIRSRKTPAQRMQETFR